jgi:predicted amidophosphoribosyltransferase
VREHADSFVSLARPGEHVLVLDNVITTGATMTAACAVIRARGAVPFPIAILRSEVSS